MSFIEKSFKSFNIIGYKFDYNNMYSECRIYLDFEDMVRVEIWNKQPYHNRESMILEYSTEFHADEYFKFCNFIITICRNLTNPFNESDGKITKITNHNVYRINIQYGNKTDDHALIYKYDNDRIEYILHKCIHNGNEIINCTYYNHVFDNESQTSQYVEFLKKIANTVNDLTHADLYDQNEYHG